MYIHIHTHIARGISVLKQLGFYFNKLIWVSSSFTFVHQYMNSYLYVYACTSFKYL